MSRALFVSDIHIHSPDDPKCALIVRVLDHCLQAQVADLFLVGDIFDLWISDRPYFVEQYEPVIARLRHLQRQGVRVHYFEGNHDLDLKRFWQKQLGVKVHTEAADFAINNLKIRVEHGDQMDPGDRGYLFLRWLLRTPLLVFLQRHLPNWCVRWIGERASRTSRSYTSQVKVVSDDQVRARLRAHVEKIAPPPDLFVAGHVHVLDDTIVGQVRAINLGTWLKDPMVLVLDGPKAVLKTVDGFLNS